MDNNLSDSEHKVFYNAAAKKAGMASGGTDMRDPTRIWSDFNIALGCKEHIMRFKNAKDILCIQQDIRSVVHLLHITLGHLNCEWGHETGV